MGKPGRAEVRWGLVLGGVLLMAFGFLAILSIGMPFFVVGCLLFVAGVTGVHRTNPGIFWPLINAIIVFFAVYVLVAPLGCTSSAIEVLNGDGSSGGVATTRCSNLLGIDYSGGLSYNPPLWPAALTALGAAMITVPATRWRIRERTSA